MNMFIGREKELNKLNNLFSEEEFQFAVIYGRRRVGKTTLINHFVKDKKAIVFTGVESNIKENLALFSQSILNVNNKEVIGRGREGGRVAFFLSL